MSGKLGGVRIVAARRTAVVPANGAFRHLEVFDLAAPVIAALLADAGIDAAEVDEVILGNALYGGGNPARVAALAAGLPVSVAAMTIDTQCCAGLDAIALGASRIASGQARVLIAGGVESFSRAPLRHVRPRQPGESPKAYDRPPFTPWPDRDPDMIAAAGRLADERGITRERQDAWAVESHRNALAACDFLRNEIVDISGVYDDLFTRKLTIETCARLPALAGSAECAITAATTAVEADSASLIILISDENNAKKDYSVQVLDYQSKGADPAYPGLAPIAATEALLARLGWRSNEIAVAEVMEAFAAQAIACVEGSRLDPARVNRGGGALARGHPIGASGAILVVRMFHELMREPSGARGLAMIAAAGGLGSAMAFQRG